ncbi:MAG: YdcH family protein [SAR324 cluster bacterium]|nr:YdcH family protein [SAR324 cluster bacterium]
MEAQDIAIVEKHRKDNYQLDRLFKEHQEIGARIEKLEASKGLGANEEAELHDLKKKKLEGRDQLEEILVGLR